MSNDITYIDIDEFREQGYLQEVNRLVLHPAGLALEITEPGYTPKDIRDWFAEHLNVDVDEGITLDQVMALLESLKLTKTFISGVWDYRDDPEGMVYGKSQMTAEKREQVREEWDKHFTARCEMLGEGGVPPLRVQRIDEEPRVK